MASVSKVNGSWLAQVRRKGVAQSKRFRLKTDAIMWAAKIEADLEAHARGDLPKFTLLDALNRYQAEITPRHRSSRAETSMIGIIKRSSLPINRAISKITSADISAWRDNRSAQVSDASVNRELTIIKQVFSIALREWGWLASNPCLSVSKKPQPAPRDRLISPDERVRIIEQLQGKPYGVRHQTRTAFELAIETGMRLSEIKGLRLNDITGRVAHLTLTKNGTSRDVPLSKRALELLAQIEHKGQYFSMQSGSISQAFTKAVARAGIINLHFHDTRHAAITALAKKLTVLELARAIGHKDVRSLMTYYNETAENLAEKLG
jgi:integrase